MFWRTFEFIDGSQNPLTPFSWTILIGRFALARLRKNWRTPKRLSRQQGRAALRRLAKCSFSDGYA